ncbi:ABC transporter substrate-binding protein, partial [Rhizobium leguminosarum]
MKFSAILLCGVAAFSAFAAPAFSKDWTKATITLEAAERAVGIGEVPGRIGAFE